MKNNILALVNPAAIHVMWLLDNGTHEARLCGGAVRDILLGIKPKDWDIATTALPEQVMKIMSDHGIRVIPTGLQHGTVTAMIGEEPIEITTLRIDQETDGRHAVVKFTTDWEKDAARRDFTMNAMYIDADGEICDYFGGQSDLAERRLIFVGDADSRIKEDYLRILRWFRFRGRINRPETPALVESMEWCDADYDTLAVINKNRQGLDQISGERIWDELKKIMSNARTLHSVFEKMRAFGITKQLGLANTEIRMENSEESRILDSRPHIIMGAMFPEKDLEHWHDLMKDRFHASNVELAPIKFTMNHNDLPRTRVNAFKLLGFYDKDLVLAWIAMGHNATDTVRGRKMNFRRQTPVNRVGLYDDLYTVIADVVVPVFPLRGKDLIDTGIPVGPGVGTLLRELRTMWSDAEFSLDRDYMLSVVHTTGGHL